MAFTMADVDQFIVLKRDKIDQHMAQQPFIDLITMTGRMYGSDAIGAAIQLTEVSIWMTVKVAELLHGDYEVIHAIISRIVGANSSGDFREVNMQIQIILEIVNSLYEKGELDTNKYLLDRDHMKKWIEQRREDLLAEINTDEAKTLLKLNKSPYKNIEQVTDSFLAWKWLYVVLQSMNADDDTISNALSLHVTFTRVGVDTNVVALGLANGFMLTGTLPISVAGITKPIEPNTRTIPKTSEN